MTGLASLQRRDNRPIPDQASEVRAFLVVRNELHRLPFLLAHHRALGVGRFFAIDNDSRDGTVEYLLEQNDIHVFSTKENYETARLGIDWIESLLNAYGQDRWCLVLDADELLVYPGCAQMPLDRFCGRLEASGLNCLATMFIDLYADGPICGSRLRPDETPLERFRFFDRSGYHNVPTWASCLPRIYGGVRARLFWPDVDVPRTLALLERARTEAFDQAGYLDKYPDVRDAIGRGAIESGLDHFVKYGWLEGRDVVVRSLPWWPEEGYRSGHADVREAIANGIYASGLEHFVRRGQFESRLPAPWPPCLSQVPLMRWQPGLALRIGRHSLAGATWRRPGAVGGALLHFRLMPDMGARARASARYPDEASVDEWSAENARYNAVLSNHPQLHPACGLTERYVGAEQLVHLRLVQPLEDL